MLAIIIEFLCNKLLVYHQARIYSLKILEIFKCALIDKSHLRSKPSYFSNKANSKNEI